MIYDGVIQGKSVHLRSAQMEDAEYTYSIRQDPERTKYMHPVSGGIDAQRAWLQKQMETPGDYFFVIFNNANEKIGTYSIYGIDKNTGEGVIGRSLLNGDPIQNLESIFLMHEFAFYTLGLKELTTWILEGNYASAGLTQKMGGKKICEEYNEEFDMPIDCYQITREAYAEKRAALKKLVERFTARTK